MTDTVLIRFLFRLITDVDRKVFLILHSHSVHHSKAVRKWLSEHLDRIEVFHLPPYTPEHNNPDEYVNENLRQRIQFGVPANNSDDLARKTGSFIKTLQRRPDHVGNYFNHLFVRYAAWLRYLGTGAIKPLFKHLIQQEDKTT